MQRLTPSEFTKRITDLKKCIMFEFKCSDREAQEFINLNLNLFRNKLYSTTDTAKVFSFIFADSLYLLELEKNSILTVKIENHIELRKHVESLVNIFNFATSRKSLNDSKRKKNYKLSVLDAVNAHDRITTGSDMYGRPYTG